MLAPCKQANCEDLLLAGAEQVGEREEEVEEEEEDICAQIDPYISAKPLQRVEPETLKTADVHATSMHSTSQTCNICANYCSQ